jgi:hypothetical protein
VVVPTSAGADLAKLDGGTDWDRPNGGGYDEDV